MVERFKERIKALEYENAMIEEQSAILVEQHKKNVAKIEVYEEVVAEMTAAEETITLVTDENQEITMPSAENGYNFDTGM